MLKIMLKEPVGGTPTGARSTHYMLAFGDLTDDGIYSINEALLQNKCVRFMALDSRKFVVPASNIAYVLEVPDGQQAG